jgi:hypothetical protein
MNNDPATEKRHPVNRMALFLSRSSRHTFAARDRQRNNPGIK